MVDLGDSNRAHVRQASAHGLRSGLPLIEDVFDAQLNDTFGAKLLSTSAAQMAREFLQNTYPEMMAAYNDLSENLESQGHHLTEHFYKRSTREAPLIVLEVSEKSTGSWLVPNINLFLEPPYDNLRDQGSASQKQVAALPGESNALGEGSLSKYQLEKYSPQAALRLVFFPTSESGVIMPDYRATVPLVMRVQMNSVAEREALRHAEMRLSGASGSYSYLFDDLLIPMLRADLNRQSQGFAGIRDKPEILSERSYLKDNSFTCTATVRKTDANTAQKFSYGVVNDNGPFLDIVST